MTDATRFDDLFAGYRSSSIPDLWPWQHEVLEGYDAVAGDVAIELPTGSGKTLVGLLVGEDFRRREGRPVAYLAGTKQLAHQVERQARQLGINVVRFQGSKETWSRANVRSYNFAQAIGVMNYWNYFNASPGIGAAGLLILDDVHLLEQPLREMYTVTVPRGELFDDVLRRILALCPYYSQAEDLLNGVDPIAPPEMLAFPDSADLADDLRGLLDARLAEGSNAWWAWQQIRRRAEVCCWLVSRRGLSVGPYVPPAQDNAYFSGPSRRLYLSATIGSEEDLRRRIGAPTVTKVTASVQPRQGDRFVLLADRDRKEIGTLLDAVIPLVNAQRKALWLCARKETSETLQGVLEALNLGGHVRVLEGDNGADELFSADAEGHLIAAGRYDGMDFPGETCRLEILPEVPVATSDLEEWTTAYLRDAAFAEMRFSQRLAQALGRCNRTHDDRAVYVLADAEFVTRCMDPNTVNSLPTDVRSDVFTALERSDRGLEEGLDEALRFLGGEDFTSAVPPTAVVPTARPATAGLEVDGYLALWREDYDRADMLFERVTDELSGRREHRAFWLSLRGLALQLRGSFGDRGAERQGLEMLEAAAMAGSATTFFTRLRLARGRKVGQAVAAPGADYDPLFAAWDGLIARVGVMGPRFERWTASLVEDLASNDHDTVGRAIARVGTDLLGLPAETPRPTSGEHDVQWEYSSPARVLTFEVKLAPGAQRTSNGDVEQAEGATRAVSLLRGLPARGLLVTPWPAADETALQRLDLVRLIRSDVFVAETNRLIVLLNEYRRGWSEDASAREARRTAVEPDLPPRDWLWQALQLADDWVDEAAIGPRWRLRR